MLYKRHLLAYMAVTDVSYQKMKGDAGIEALCGFRSGLFVCEILL